MQAKKKTVVLIEPAAGNVDAAYQRAVLKRYAELHRLEIDHMYGEYTPLAGEPRHRDLVNDIKSGGVSRLLILADVRHGLARDVLKAARKAGVEVEFVDVEQNRGLAQ